MKRKKSGMQTRSKNMLLNAQAIFNVLLHSSLVHNFHGQQLHLAAADDGLVTAAQRE